MIVTMLNFCSIAIAAIIFLFPNQKGKETDKGGQDNDIHATRATLMSLPLVAQNDFDYLGAFRVPKVAIGGTSFEYGGGALAYNAMNHSLFIVGHAWHQKVAEISIPREVNSRRLDDLRIATFLQSFFEPTEELRRTADTGSLGIGGLMVWNSRLYGTVFSYYDGDASQRISHFRRPLDLSIRGAVEGLFEVGALRAGPVAGWLVPVPVAWQEALGGPALTGQCCLAIISRTSAGPAAFSFDPAQLGSKAAPARALLYYPLREAPSRWEATSDFFNGTTAIRGLVLPDHTRSALFFGRQGVGPFCYGTGAECGDPADGSKGTHAFPYVYQVWAYDLLDLAAVRADKRVPSSVRPYAMWRLELPFSHRAAFINGAAYDPASGTVWLSQAFGDGAYPIIYAFQIATDRVKGS